METFAHFEIYDLKGNRAAEGHKVTLIVTSRLNLSTIITFCHSIKFSFNFDTIDTTYAIMLGVNSMAKDPLAQDSMTNDFYFTEFMR